MTPEELKSYKRDFDKKNYAFIGIKIPKSKKAEFITLAKNHAPNVSAFIIQTIEQCYKIDLHTK